MVDAQAEILAFTSSPARPLGEGVVYDPARATQQEQGSETTRPRCRDLARTRPRTLAQLPLTFSTDRGTEWGMVMAAGSLTLLPVIAFALLVQRHILRGMTLGAVKG